MSCLAEQAKILVAEAEENNLGKVRGFIVVQVQWATASCGARVGVLEDVQCRSFGGVHEQRHHHEDAVSVMEAECALGWACWKHLRAGRWAGRRLAMREHEGFNAEHYEEMNLLGHVLSITEDEVEFCGALQATHYRTRGVLVERTGIEQTRALVSRTRGRVICCKGCCGDLADSRWRWGIT